MVKYSKENVRFSHISSSKNVFAVFTADSALPLDWMYLGLLVMCWNSYDSENSLKVCAVY